MEAEPSVQERLTRGLQEKGDLLQSVQRALGILNLIAQHPQGLSARQVSTALQLNISTCYHVLNTLVADGYLERHPQEQIYQLGPQIPFLNNAFIKGLSSREDSLLLSDHPYQQDMSLTKRLRPILYRLMETTQEPSYLECWCYGEAVLTSIIDAPEAVKLSALYVGYQGPAHCQALGKVLLAYSDSDFVNRYLDLHPLSPVGPNTIVQRTQFFEELNTIARQGYSIDKEEFDADTYCIAAPVFSSQGKLVAGLAISFARSALDRRAEWLIEQVTRAAQRASTELRLACPSL